MAFSKKKALEIMGALIENYSNDPTWYEIIQLMNNLPINFSPYMIYGEDFDSFNTILLLDLDRDINLKFLDKEDLIEFLKDVNFLTYVNSYKIYHDSCIETNPNNYIEEFNFFIENIIKLN